MAVERKNSYFKIKQEARVKVNAEYDAASQGITTIYLGNGIVRNTLGCSYANIYWPSGSNHGAFYLYRQLVHVSAVPLIMCMYSLSRGMAYVR